MQNWKCDWQTINEGFILTKWYVNHSYIVGTTGSGKSFILTKWYVNEKVESYEEKKIEKFYIN